MRLGVFLAAVVGLILATVIVGYFGFGAVIGAVARIGWRGLLFLCVYSALPFSLLGGAWYVLGHDQPLSRWPTYIRARVVRDSAGELLPFSHLGGFVIGARAAILEGIAPTVAFSTTLVDVTAELIAQLGFSGLGLGMLAIRLGSRSMHNALIGAAILGLMLSAAGAVLFVTLQRRGSGAVARLIERFAPDVAAQAGEVGKALNELYERPARVAVAVAAHLAAWIASGLGAWLALRIAGVAIGAGQVLAIESLVASVRSAAFMAPMGVGVQEATYALVGPLFGLGPELALALSLIKRGRDLAIGIPALIAWQAVEGRRLLRTRGAVAGDDL